MAFWYSRLKAAQHSSQAGGDLVLTKARFCLIVLKGTVKSKGKNLGFEPGRSDLGFLLTHITTIYIPAVI